LVEDIEYGTRLALAGIPVTYVPEARLYGQAASTGKQALSQRLRWEGGRGAQARKDVPPLLKAAVKQRSFIPFDRAVDLTIPPLGLLFSLTAFFGSLNLGAWAAFGGTWLGLTAALWLAPISGIVLFVFAGLVIARVPAKAYLALAFAPFYIIWKLWVYFLLLTRRLPTEWVRTTRSQIDVKEAQVESNNW
jgi:cellulose synthase/poly-beta-1,6-N-acetylglucosamine synthase-like glycosyltransferase